MTGELIGFDYHPRTRVVFGENSVDRLGELVAELGVRKVLLVTDPGVAAAGHADRARAALDSARLQSVTFDRVRENPTTRDVDRCLEVAREGAIDGIVGLGGGSSMDTAKGCNFLLTNGGRMQDYRGVGKAGRPMLPLVAVPTTTGTGSECQSFALIAEEETHRKMACGDPKAAARTALLDPTLTVTQPAHVTAATGIDAIAHALETSVTSRRNPISWLLSREAFRLTNAAFLQELKDPQDLGARASMQLGAACGGAAIENSMLGAAHSAANPLTARYGVVHGQAVGIMLPAVVHFNGRDPAALAQYWALAVDAGVADREDDEPRALEALVARLELFLNAAGVPRSLEELGVGRADLPALAEEAAGQWTASFNPRRVQAADFEALYRQTLEPRLQMAGEAT